MEKLTIEDAKRLLDAGTFERLESTYGDTLANILETAEQPPELGICSRDDRLMVMLLGVVSAMRIGAMPIGGGYLFAVKAQAGETQDDVAQRIAKQLNARVL